MSAPPETASSTAPLDYAPPSRVRPRMAAFYAAVVCWAGPLFVGLAILGLYAVTSADFLTTLGLLTIAAGAVLMLIGIPLCVWFAESLKASPPDVRQLWTRRSKILGVLLVLNVPIALGCAAAGIWLMGRYTVIVVNNTTAPLQNVTISGTGATLTMGTVAPGTASRLSFTVRSEGDVAVSVVHNGTPISRQADVFLTGMDGGSTTFTFTPTGVNVRSR